MPVPYPVSVAVNTETGCVAFIDFEYDPYADVFHLKIRGQLLEQSPEALTASVQMALLYLKGIRP